VVPRTETTTLDELGNPSYELFILALSLLSIVNSVLLLTFVSLGAGAVEVVGIVDGVVTLIFLIDFAQRLLGAPNRRRYFLRERGFLDLLGSLPYLKVFRIFRVLRVLRLLRTYGLRALLRWFLDHRAQGALYVVLTLAIVVLECSALVILPLEDRSADANITTGGDALWWVITTMTTVGYGDEYPVTTGGRFVGVLVMVIGVALFGTLSGFLANAFLAPRRAAAEPSPVATDMGARLADLRGLLDEQQRANAVLLDRLAEIERLAQSSPESATAG